LKVVVINETGIEIPHPWNNQLLINIHFNFRWYFGLGGRTAGRAFLFCLADKMR
jgi:hypothetical protein